jgi:hypothetical protein
VINPKGCNAGRSSDYKLNKTITPGNVWPESWPGSRSKLMGESSIWGHNWGHIDFLIS